MRIHLLVTAGILLIAEAIGAQPTPLRVLASAGMQAVITQLRPRIEKELGRPCDIRFETSVAVRGLIDSGTPFDATVLTKEVMAEVIRAGKIDSHTEVEL